MIKKKLIIIMLNIKIKQIYNIINILLKCNQYLNFINNKIAIDLKLQNINKYYKYIN